MSDERSSLIDAFAGKKVVVVGEAMLDCFLYGRSLRPSAREPVISAESRSEMPGGAAGVALSARNLGAEVRLISVVGGDREGDALQAMLQQQGVNPSDLLVQANRRTWTRHHVAADGRVLLSFDQVDTEPIDPDIEEGLITRLFLVFDQCDMLIISDYGRGLFTPRVIAGLNELQSERAQRIVVDSLQLSEYLEMGVEVVAVDERQVADILEVSLPNDLPLNESSLAQHAERLLDRTGAQTAIVILDTEGIVVVQRSRAPRRVSIQSPHVGSAREVFLAALGLSFAAGAEAADAAARAAATAAAVAREAKPATCGPDELREESVTLDR